MIDFRYHVVSIVSIFLALAVGIVLGAGPLQGKIGDSLQHEVENLRKTLSDRSSQLSDAQTGETNRDKFLSALKPGLVNGKLGGRSVTLVTLPGASGSLTKDTQTVLEAAGATVNGTVKITTAWTDPTKKDFRASLAKSLEPLTTTTPPAGATLDEGLADVLARGLVVNDVTNQDRTDSSATSALQGLKTGGVIDYSGKPPNLSSLVVVVAGGPSANEPASQQQAEASSYAVIARTLDAASSGVIAVSDADGAANGAALHAIRSDKQASEAVSTVDDVDQEMGQITEVLALREQLLGQSGQYGTADSADKIVPSDAGL